LNSSLLLSAYGNVVQTQREKLTLIRHCSADTPLFVVSLVVIPEITSEIILPADSATGGYQHSLFGVK
jgi:hypothetical protein